MLVSVEPKFEACSYIINTYNAKANLMEQQQQQKEQNKAKNKGHNSHRLFALGLLATVFMLLIICAQIRMSSAVVSPLTQEELQELCPEEKEFCIEKALKGNCYGKSVKAGHKRKMNLTIETLEMAPYNYAPTVKCKLWYKKIRLGAKAQLLAKHCKCSCHNTSYRRIQNCCRTVGDHDMKFCLPLCGYNTSAIELGSGLGLKCVSQLSTWAYCASDGNDNTECCKTKGVEEQCFSFCKGDVPTCDMQSIFSYQPCLMKLDKILECQMKNLESNARFDPNWRPECDWQK